MWNNWQYRLLALLMAIACWYVVSGQEKVETWLEVPLEFVNLPQQMELTSGFASKIQVRIRGTSNQVRSLNTSRLAYKLDLGNIQVGKNVIALVPENMTITSAIEVVEISPAKIELVADVTISKTLPVQLLWEGLPGEDMEFRQATLSPDRIVLTGFASALEGLESVPTVKVQVPQDGSRSTTGRAKLMLPKGIRSNVASVGYEMEFGLITQEIWVKMTVDPVEYNDFSYSFEPKHVRVKLDMPVYLLKNKDWRESLHLQLDPGINPTLGQSMIKPKPKLPDDVRVLELKPEELSVTIQRHNSVTP